MLKTVRIILKPLQYQKRWLLEKAEAIPKELRPTEEGNYPKGCSRIIHNALQEAWQTCRTAKQIPLDKQMSKIMKKDGVLFLKIQQELIPFRIKSVDKLDNLLLDHYNSAVVWLKSNRWIADAQIEIEDQYVVGRPEAIIGIDLGKWHNCYSIWADEKEVYRAFDQFGNHHKTMQKIQDDISKLQQDFKGSRKQLSQKLRPLYEKKRMVLRQYYGTLRNRILEHAPEGYNAVFVVEDLDDLPRAELSKAQRTWANQELANGIFASQIGWNGYKIVKVNPRGTTHTCSKCGRPVKSFKNRKIVCETCYPKGLDRDLNGARNIARRYMLSCTPQRSCSGETDFPTEATCETGMIEQKQSESNEPPTLVAERLQ
jgi:transposase